LDPIGVKQYAPLFGKDPIAGLEEMFELGFKCLVIEVDTALGANKDWLGKVIDRDILDEIKQRVAEKKINPIGEWGEYHTLVVDCPIYKKKIAVEKAKTEWKNTKGEPANQITSFKIHTYSIRSRLCLQNHLQHYFYKIMNITNS
jgi:uncharacterized protein (TIGR00290 family)